MGHGGNLRSSMMSYVICCFLQLSWFGGLASKVILANQGGSVKLFENTNYMFNEVSLYIHENRTHKLIVTWTYKEVGFFSSAWRNKNYSKIFMDPHGIIQIADVDGNYQKQYSINNSTSPEVELIILEKRLFHEGDLVHLFKSVDEPDKEVQLWINEDINYTHIITWRIDNKNITAAWMTNKYKKIKMDENRDIYIDNVDANYNGKYFIFNSSRLGVDLTILGSSQVNSGSGMIAFYVIIVVLAIALIIVIFGIIIKCLRKSHGRSHRDIPPTGTLRSRSSSDSSVISNGEEHELNQMRHNKSPTGSLLSRSLPNSSENVIEETQRKLRQMRSFIPATKSLLPRSSPNSEENVIEETQRKLRQMRSFIPATKSLLPRSSPNSEENVIGETQRRLRQMISFIPATKSLLPRSSPNSEEGEEKGKSIEHEEKSKNLTINLSQELRKKAYQGYILDSGMMLRPRRSMVIQSDK